MENIALEFTIPETLVDEARLILPLEIFLQETRSVCQLIVSQTPDCGLDRWPVLWESRDAHGRTGRVARS